MGTPVDPRAGHPGQVRHGVGVPDLREAQHVEDDLLASGRIVLEVIGYELVTQGGDGALLVRRRCWGRSIRTASVEASRLVGSQASV
jgi:hypothetical protein